MNHFEVGGKTLISPDMRGPIRLLESDKSVTYFKEKPLSGEMHQLSRKFKDKIERQNWNIKQANPRSIDSSQELSREGSFYNKGVADYDNSNSSR